MALMLHSLLVLLHAVSNIKATLSETNYSKTTPDANKSFGRDNLRKQVGNIEGSGYGVRSKGPFSFIDLQQSEEHLLNNDKNHNFHTTKERIQVSSGEAQPNKGANLRFGNDDTDAKRVKRLASSQVSAFLMGKPTHLCMEYSCWGSCGQGTSTFLDCSCVSTCYTEGNCCIDYEWECDTSAWASGSYSLDKLLLRRLEFIDQENMEPFSVMNTLEARYGEDGLSRYKATYSEIVKCPGNVTDEVLRKRCENSSVITEDPQLSLVPVYDEDGLVYKNVYCASCHGVTFENMTFPFKKYACFQHIQQEILSEAPFMTKQELYQRVTECRPFLDLKNEDIDNHPLLGLHTCDKAMAKLSPDYETNKAACLSYTNPVVSVMSGSPWQPGRIYKNEHCIRCSVPDRNDGPLFTQCVYTSSLFDTIDKGIYVDIDIDYMHGGASKETTEYTISTEGSIICSPPTYTSLISGSCVDNKCLHRYVVKQEDCLQGEYNGLLWSNTSDTDKHRYTITLVVNSRTDDFEYIIGTADFLSNITNGIVSRYKIDGYSEILEMIDCPKDDQFVRYLEDVLEDSSLCLLIHVRSSQEFQDFYQTVHHYVYMQPIRDRDTLHIAVTNYNPGSDWKVCPGSKPQVLRGVHIVAPVVQQSDQTDNSSTSEFRLNKLVVAGDKVMPIKNQPLLIVMSTSVGKNEWDFNMRAMVCPPADDHNIVPLQPVTTYFLLFNQDLCQLLNDIRAFPSVFALVNRVMSGISLLAAWVSLWRQKHLNPFLKAAIISYLLSHLMGSLISQVRMNLLQRSSLSCQIVTAIEFYFRLCPYLWLNIVVVEILGSIVKGGIAVLKAPRRMALYFLYAWCTPLLGVVLSIGGNALANPKTSVSGCSCWVNVDQNEPTLFLAALSLVTLVLDIGVILKFMTQQKLNSNQGQDHFCVDQQKMLLYLLQSLMLLLAVDLILKVVVELLHYTIVWYVSVVFELGLCFFFMVLMGFLVPRLIMKIEKNGVTTEQEEES